MATRYSLAADELAATAADNAAEENVTLYGLERDVADMHQPLVESSGRRKHRMLPGGRWFVRPAQRQLWGDEQVLVRHLITSPSFPHTPHTALTFFTLFVCTPTASCELG